MSAYATQMSEVSKSVVYVVQAVRNGTALTGLADFAYHLWNIQGYLQGITLGYPTGVDILSGAIATDSPNRVQLEDLKCLANLESMVVFGAHDAKGLSPIQMIQLAKLIFDMLKSLGIFDKDENKPVNGPKTLDAPPPVDKELAKKLALAEKADKGDKKAIEQIEKDAVAQGYDPNTYGTWVDLAKVLYSKEPK